MFILRRTVRSASGRSIDRSAGYVLDSENHRGLLQTEVYLFWSKNGKNKPRIVYRVGKEDKLIKEYLETYETFKDY